MKTFAGIAVILFFGIASFAFSYEVILKNGKTFKGTLIHEDEEKITIKDKDGITFNFKKSTVDLEKTSEANKPVDKPVVEEKKAAEPVEETPAKPKKPARVYDQSDVYRLRSEYPMESGAGVQFDEAAPRPAAKGRSGDEWQQITQSLLAQIKSSEEAYQRLSAKCREFQGATIQTHIAVTPEGKQTDLVEAKERTCQSAEDAKAALEAARAEHAAAVEQARQENIPTGYIVTE